MVSGGEAIQREIGLAFGRKWLCGKRRKSAGEVIQLVKYLEAECEW